MSRPAGGPHFRAPGSWDAYVRWSLFVPCQGCGKRKIDNAARYGLEQLGSWPEYWVTEEWCSDCWRKERAEQDQETSQGNAGRGGG